MTVYSVELKCLPLWIWENTTIITIINHRDLAMATVEAKAMDHWDLDPLDHLDRSLSSSTTLCRHTTTIMECPVDTQVANPTTEVTR
jgi:hypothetical protein